MSGRRIFVHFLQLVWLLFMAYPLVFFVGSKPSTAVLIAGLAGAATFVGVYCWLWIRLYPPRLTPAVWVALGALFAIALLLSLFDGQTWGTLFIYVIAAFAGNLPSWRRAAFATVAITGLMSGLAGFEGAGIWTAAVAFEGLIVGAIVLVSVHFARTSRALSEAREEVAHLMVAEERLRFARDLHDLLGHSLSLIVLKAELAGKLVGSSPDRVAGEVADIERVARQALAEVREAVSGYREASLSVELEQARVALIAAGIQVRVERSDDSLPMTAENVLAWALREGVTNVIRHAGATATRIKLQRSDGQAELELTDNGRGALEFAPGNGLNGLRERVSGRNGQVEFGPAAGGGFRLHVSVPV